MARDIRTGYDLAFASTPFIHGVIPVGEAWSRAIETGGANSNPYDGIAPGEIDLWTYDHQHGSTFGYYLEALMIFGDLTGLDPRSLGKNARSAFELGFSPDQTSALQQVAYDELTAAKPQSNLKKFTPINPGNAAESEFRVSAVVNERDELARFHDHRILHKPTLNDLRGIHSLVNR